MRAVLVDWLVSVHRKLEMVPETLFQTVRLLDRYLGAPCAPAVPTNQLQPFMIACKYEEIWPRTVGELCSLCDDAYTPGALLAMEGRMLQALRFQITSPSVLAFLTRYAKVAQGNGTVLALAQYYADRMLLQHSAIQWPPSHLGATALSMARRTGGKTLWKADLEEYSGYSTAARVACYNAMLGVMQPGAGSEKNRTLTAVVNKHSLPAFGEVAQLFPLPPMAA
jgi:cyclin B